MNMERSAALIERIERLPVPDGQLAVWALGQSGMVIKGGTTIAYIDPYLSDSVAAVGGPARRIPAPLDPHAIRHADAVFATHEHLDHLDPDTLKPLLAASPNAVLITSAQGRTIAADNGIAADRIVAPKLHEPANVGGLRYTALPSAHYSVETDDEQHTRWMGFLISCNGVTLYHSGDTIIVPELLAALDGATIDLALLPINGRDYFREQEDIVGNLLPHEAVQLAQRIGARVLIAMHNDMFELNRVDSGLLWSAVDRYAPFQRTHMLQAGELYLYAG